MIRSWTTVLALAAALLASPALAQEEPATRPATDENTDMVSVFGRQLDIHPRDYALDFVLEIGDPPTDANGYARWSRDICVAVEYAPADAAQYVADRISEIAVELGLRPGGPGCRPNVGISFTTDAVATASRLVKERRRFRPSGYNFSNQGLQALEEFARSDAPVRWWQLTTEVDRTGMPAIADANTTGTPPTIAAPNSRIRNSVSDALLVQYVVVDARKVNSVSWSQLGDYLAFVSLAQVKPGAQAAGYDSILNLFDSANPPSELTDWDWSYLHALYDLDTQLYAGHQRGALADLILRRQTAAVEEN